MKYTHDCLFCQPLGSFQNHDLYFCDSGGLPTVLARYGNNPSHVISGLFLADTNPILMEARARAIQSNFYPRDALPLPPPPKKNWLRTMTADTIIALLAIGTISLIIALVVGR